MSDSSDPRESSSAALGRAELEAQLDELEKVRTHRDWRISELEKHISNLDALDQVSSKRIAELEAHTANVDALRNQAETRVGELEQHVANLDEYIAGTGDLRRAGYRSQFGGLWPDRADAKEVLAAKREAQAITELESEQFEFWIQHGWLHLPGAIPTDDIDGLCALTDPIFASENPKIHACYFEHGELLTTPIEPRHSGMRAKVLDLYAELEAARKVVFASPILNFLRLLFADEPMAFQSLYFLQGSEQPIHQDTAYVGLRDRLEFIGCWVALEDGSAGSGELEYYDGSHLFDDFIWDGRTKLMPEEHPDHQRYLDSLHEQAQRLGCERIRFLPKKGDALIWAADLAHGGAAQTQPAITRKSIATHFCAVDNEPLYFQNGSSRSKRIRHESGAYYCYRNY